MIRSEETWFVVLVTDGAKVAPDDLKVGILADVILRHLEHSEVEVGNGAKGAASDQYDGLFVGIAERSLKAMGRKSVAWRVREGFSWDVGTHGERPMQRWGEEGAGECQGVKCEMYIFSQHSPPRSAEVIHSHALC